ncbi:MAG: cell envelope integrity protein TolA [Pseudohongiellaceae bacterium]
MTAFNGYPLSIALALILHGLIIGALLWMQQASTEVSDVVRPPSVKALLVEENPQQRNEQRQQQQDLERQRREEQQRREAEQAEAEAQARREREEQQRREQEQQQRQQEEQRREQELAEQRERERQQEAERQRQEEQRRQEQARQEELARQRQAEAAAEAAAAEQAETDAEMVGAYTAIIHDLVQQNWSRPPSARNDMTAVLRIQLVPTGEVVDVQVVQSSGDAAFDRAAENAVYAVGRFSELQGMPPRLFERNFRSLLLTFRPEDLRN